jgi:hypothetical protein
MSFLTIGDQGLSTRPLLPKSGNPSGQSNCAQIKWNENRTIASDQRNEGELNEL